MMKFGLVNLGWVIGGAETYAINLCHGLRKLGHDANIYIIDRQPRKYAHMMESPYNHYMGYKKERWVDEAIQELNSCDVLHFCMLGATNEDKMKEAFPPYWSILMGLEQDFYGCLHGPYDLKWAKYWQLMEWKKIIYPRPMKTIGAEFEKEYPEFKGRTWQGNLPIVMNKEHPNIYEKQDLVVSASRIDWVKNIDKLVKFSEQIKAQVEIWGFANDKRNLYRMEQSCPSNTMFMGTYKYTDQEFIYSRAKVSTDFTVQKNDFGSQQYVTLESFNYGAVPVVHKNWVGYFKADKNVIPFDKFEEAPEKINSLLNDTGLRTEMAEANFELLKENHASTVVAQKYIDEVWR